MSNLDPRSISLTPVRQTVSSERIEDVEGAVRRSLAELRSSLRRGMSIGIGVGSRGLASLPELVRATVAVVRECGAEPFVFPAMGCHGGATAHGQEEILTSYGITLSSVGAPVRSSLEVVAVPSSDTPGPLHVLRSVEDADGTLIINRVKSHTDFEGRYESGLVKMSVIGLGGTHQAEHVHGFGVRGLRDLIPKYSQTAMRHGKILGGIATIENGRGELNEVAYLPAARILEGEPELLCRAKALQSKLPIERADLLIVDRMGKDISGTGMDTKVIGRIRVPEQDEPSAPNIGCVMVRSLTPASHGNAVGVGLADVITAQLHAQIDFEALACNALTSNFLERGRIPLVAPNDRTAIEWAAKLAKFDLASARIVRIRDTMHLETLLVSASLLHELQGREGIQCEDGRVPLVGPDESLPEAGLWS